MSCLLAVPLLRGSFASNILARLTQIAVRSLRLAFSPQDWILRRVNRARRCLCLSSPVRPCSGSVRRGSTSGTYSTPLASSAHRPVPTGERPQHSCSPKAPARAAVVPCMSLRHPLPSAPYALCLPSVFLV